MSYRKVSSKAVALPDNLHWLEFERSDGDPNTWPPKSKTERVVDSEGHVNFHRIVDIDEGPAVRWRMEVGAAVANRMNLLLGPHYVLKSWPAGYQLYDHHKGPQADPRHDLYLFGPKGIRFRSINEFVPHAYWLMNPQTVCDCKYCTKRPQREISFALGLTQKLASRSPTPGRMKPGHSGPRPSDSRPRDHSLHKPYAAVQKVPRPSRDRSFWGKGPKYSMSRQRNSDLRAIQSETGMLLKRWFREGELLWCALDTPIPGRVPEEDILFWPALVQEVILKPEAFPRNDDGAEMRDVTNVQGPSSKSATQPMVASDATCPWTVRQSIIYRMKFLGVRQSACFADHRVLPYQAYIMAAGLRHAIETYPMDTVDLSPEIVSSFDPRTPSEKDPEESTLNRRFENAVGSYALALQTAAHIATFWSPTDEWEFKYAAPAMISSPNVAHSTVAEAIAAASTANAALHAEDNSRIGEKDDNVARILGQPTPPLAIPQTISQLRYQGLWWGSERIWTDDCVRLKVARKHLAPNGSKDILPAAGPSQSTIEYHAKLVGGHGSAVDGKAYGAGERGVFMKIEGLFVVDVPGGNGKKPTKECRASGMLYELADHDWVDPNDKPDAAMRPEMAQDNTRQLPSPTTLTPVGTAAIDPSLLPPTAAESEAPSGSFAKPLSSNSGLSHPRSTTENMPTPPKGYKFRPILAPSCEVVISLTLISGRYYPQLLAHPLLQPCLHRAIGSNVEKGLQEGQHLWALEGLAPGYFNAVDPSKASADRLSMVKDAERLAREDIRKWQEQLLRSRAESLEYEGNDSVPPPTTDDMDVDVGPIPASADL